MPATATVDGARFCQWLATRTTYDKEILRDVRPYDNFWLSRFPRGNWDAYSNSVLIQNRFRHVDAPNDRLWRDYANANCTTTPCDPEENEIGYGQTQLQYGLKRQSWRSPVFCFDQVMTQVLAREQVDQIVGDILRPATSRITSNLYRTAVLDAANAAGNCYMATGTLAPFTFTWNTSNDRLQGFTVTSGASAPTSLLTIEHMKQRYLPLVMKGAMGKNPTDMGHYLEAVTDLETIYRLERTANVVTANASSATQWRWTSMADNAKFHKYGWSGALGNFGMATDLYVYRFNEVSAGVYQLVPPYLNVEIPANEGGGMRSVPNDNWRNANYQFTILWHQEALRALWFRAAPLHGQMPFLVRDFTGNWRFAIDNIGVANPRRNKGYFYSDFMCGIKPRYTEFIECIFHQIQPEQVVAIASTATEIAATAPKVNEDSALACCQTTTFTHVISVLRKADNSIVIPASGITCMGDIIANTEIVVAAPGTNDYAGFNTQLTQLATALNGSSTPAAAMGTWSKSADNKLTLSGTRCSSVTIAFATGA